MVRKTNHVQLTRISPCKGVKKGIKFIKIFKTSNWISFDKNSQTFDRNQNKNLLIFDSFLLTFSFCQAQLRLWNLAYRKVFCPKKYKCFLMTSNDLMWPWLVNLLSLEPWGSRIRLLVDQNVLFQNTIPVQAFLQSFLELPRVRVWNVRHRLFRFWWIWLAGMMDQLEVKTFLKWIYSQIICLIQKYHCNGHE